MSGGQRGRSGAPEPHDNTRLHGMTREEWKETDVAKATSSISCTHCGERFATPHDFYDHLDAVHPKKKGRRK